MRLTFVVPFVVELNVPTNIGWIAMKFATDVHVPLGVHFIYANFVSITIIRSKFKFTS